MAFSSSTVCDEAAIAHMLSCGKFGAEWMDSLEIPPQPVFNADPNRYLTDVRPPSMSSSNSSGGSSRSTSPVPLTRPPSTYDKLSTEQRYDRTLAVIILLSPLSSVISTGYQLSNA